MIGIEAPLWFLLLGLLPLLRWLHRFRIRSGILPTTTLFLWSALQRERLYDGSPGKPDPRWMLRASICVLMILALAGPYIRSMDETAVDVWLDDSLSMYTQERGASRIASGIEQLRAYLEPRSFSQILFHSLGDPAATLLLVPGDDSDWAARAIAWASHPRGEPSPPPAASLPESGNHVLITDGADSTLNEWARSVSLAHLIRSGELRRNLALGRLSLRQPLTEGDAIAATVRVDNPGDAAARARLVVTHSQRLIQSLEIEILPGASRSVAFPIDPGETGIVAARIESADDPLPLDDRLELGLDSLYPRIGYAVRGTCARWLMAVVDSHPALVPAQGSADLLLDCGGEARDSALPTLRLHRASSVRRTSQPAHWHRQPAAGYLPIAAGVAYSAAAPALATAEFPLLSADGRALILGAGAGRPVIDFYLDSSDPALVREAQFPLLILGLISRLTGRDLDAGPSTVGRDIRASRIAPLPLPAPSAAGIQAMPEKGYFTAWILALALLLLLADAALGLRAAFAGPGWQT